MQSIFSILILKKIKIKMRNEFIKMILLALVNNFAYLGYFRVYPEPHAVFSAFLRSSLCVCQ